MFKTVIKRILLLPVALILLFEEWGWEPLQKLFIRLREHPFWEELEDHIESLPPLAALCVLFTPWITLFPLKILALYALSHGAPFIGIGIILFAKLAGTAIVARLFTLTQPALMKFSWFAKWYPRWKSWKDNILLQVRQSWVYQYVHDLKIKITNAAKEMWKTIRR